jgi:hypothetical protein
VGLGTAAVDKADPVVGPGWGSFAMDEVGEAYEGSRIPECGFCRNCAGGFGGGGGGGRGGWGGGTEIDGGEVEEVKRITADVPLCVIIGTMLVGTCAGRWAASRHHLKTQTCVACGCGYCCVEGRTVTNRSRQTLKMIKALLEFLS